MKILIFFLYLVMGFADMFCSLIAFKFAVIEGNPLMSFAYRHGWFIPLKISFTVLIGLGLAYFYPKKPKIVWFVIYLMLAVVIYHAWGLNQLETIWPVHDTIQSLPTNVYLA